MKVRRVDYTAFLKPIYLAIQSVLWCVLVLLGEALLRSELGPSNSGSAEVTNKSAERQNYPGKTFITSDMPEGAGHLLNDVLVRSITDDRAGNNGILR